MPSIYHNFNDLQLECYNRNMNCLNCYYKQYNPKCRVKWTILQFIKEKGIPKNLKTKGVKDDR